MGLDVYAGSLTRYHSGAWTSVGQAGPRAETTDPGRVNREVLRWMTALGRHLGVLLDWPEVAGAPYDTDAPDWDGFGAVQLLAAYDMHPDLKPRRSRVFGGPPDDAATYPDAEAYRKAVADPDKNEYPTLMFSTEWWLPADLGGRVFEAQAPHRVDVVIGSVDSLLAELETLNDKTLGLSQKDLQISRREGPDGTASVEALAPFGLAVMLDLARFAAEHRCPLLLDY